MDSTRQTGGPGPEYELKLHKPNAVNRWVGYVRYVPCENPEQNAEKARRLVASMLARHLTRNGLMGSSLGKGGK